MGDDFREDEARSDLLDFGSWLGLGVGIDGAVVFVEAGEGDAAGARAGVLLVEGCGGVLEVCGPLAAQVFLRLELAGETVDFRPLRDVFGEGGKGRVEIVPGGGLFQGRCSFRGCGEEALLRFWGDGVCKGDAPFGEDAMRRNEGVFLPGGCGGAVWDVYVFAWILDWARGPIMSFTDQDRSYP